MLQGYDSLDTLAFILLAGGLRKEGAEESPLVLELPVPIWISRKVPVEGIGSSIAGGVF